MLKEFAYYNERLIEDKDLIKEIEENGELICTQRGTGVCVATIDRYYYYNDYIIRVERTNPPKKKFVESLEKKFLEGESIIFADENQKLKYGPEEMSELEKILSLSRIENLKSQVGKSVVWKCVQENLLITDVKVFPYLVNCELFEKDLEKKIELINDIRCRIDKEDLVNKITSCDVCIKSCVNGTTMSMSLKDVKIREIKKSIYIKGNESSFLMEIKDDNLGIAHQVIDEYREVYKVHLAKDSENYVDISILFMNNEKKCVVFGAILED